MATQTNDLTTTDLQRWLTRIFDAQALDISPLSGDAGSRKYYRLNFEKKSYIVTDFSAQPDNLTTFVNTARLFDQAGINIPELIFADYHQGFLIQSDLGHCTLLASLKKFPEKIQHYYCAALTELLTLQQATWLIRELPEYDEKQLKAEIELFPNWYCDVGCHQPLTTTELGQWQTFSNQLNNRILHHPRSLVHRDYHSRNIMHHLEQTVLIDFQDAVAGSVCYDVVSLIFDCYIKLTPKHQEQLLKQHFQGLIANTLIPCQTTFAQYLEWCQDCAVQRLLKILGIFTRLAKRDHKQQFLADLPMALEHLHTLIADNPRYQVIDQLLRKRLMSS